MEKPQGRKSVAVKKEAAAFSSVAAPADGRPGPSARLLICRGRPATAPAGEHRGGAQPGRRQEAVSHLFGEKMREEPEAEGAGPEVEDEEGAGDEGESCQGLQGAPEVRASGRLLTKVAGSP